MHKPQETKHSEQAKKNGNISNIEAEVDWKIKQNVYLLDENGRKRPHLDKAADGNILIEDQIWPTFENNCIISSSQ